LLLARLTAAGDGNVARHRAAELGECGGLSSSRQRAYTVIVTLTASEASNSVSSIMRLPSTR
jgi:hypothetical protein